jgi:hypothetical protein
VAGATLTNGSGRYANAMLCKQGSGVFLYLQRFTVLSKELIKTPAVSANVIKFRLY